MKIDLVHRLAVALLDEILKVLAVLCGTAAGQFQRSPGLGDLLLTPYRGEPVGQRFVLLVQILLRDGK